MKVICEATSMNFAKNVVSTELPVEHQRKCCDAIISFLREHRRTGFEGFKHIEEYLIHGKYVKQLTFFFPFIYQ